MKNDEKPDRASNPSRGTNSRSIPIVHHRRLLDLLIDSDGDFLKRIQEQCGIVFETQHVDTITFAIAYEGLVLLKARDLDGALEIFQGLEMFSGAIEHDRGLEIALLNQRVIHMVRNHLDAAMEIIKKEEAYYLARDDSLGLHEVVNMRDVIIRWKAEGVQGVADDICEVQSVPNSGAAYRVTIKGMDECDKDTSPND